MHQGAMFLGGGGGGWARGGGGSAPATTGVVRRAHPASGAQWNVQVVRGKVNGRCLWNACKALSLGLLLMVLGAAMATIGKCHYTNHIPSPHPWKNKLHKLIIHEPFIHSFWEIVIRL